LNIQTDYRGQTGGEKEISCTGYARFSSDIVIVYHLDGAGGARVWRYCFIRIRRHVSEYLTTDADRTGTIVALAGG